MPIATAINIQFSNCYYIITIGVLALLLLKDKISEKENFIFLYLGIATSFFDFLTYPLATFGVPAVIYFCMKNRESTKKKLLKLAKLLFCWGFGYSLMWASKWVLASVLTDQNVILEAINQIGIRTSHTDGAGGVGIGQITAIDAILINLKCFFHTPFTVFMVLFIVGMLIWIVIKHKNKKITVWESLKANVHFIIIALLPFIWYFITVNHSFIHAWFTHKTLVMSVLSIMCMFVKIKKEADT